MGPESLENEEKPKRLRVYGDCMQTDNFVFKDSYISLRHFYFLPQKMKKFAISF